MEKKTTYIIQKGLKIAEIRAVCEGCGISTSRLTPRSPSRGWKIKLTWDERRSIGDKLLFLFEESMLHCWVIEVKGRDALTRAAANCDLHKEGAIPIGGEEALSKTPIRIAARLTVSQARALADQEDCLVEPLAEKDDPDGSIRKELEQ